MKHSGERLENLNYCAAKKSTDQTGVHQTAEYSVDGVRRL